MRTFAHVLLVTVTLLALAAVPTRAQNTPQWEILGGYTFTHVESGKTVVPAFNFGTFPTTNFPVDLGRNYNGWHGAIAENVTSWFSGVADFGGVYRSTLVDYTSVGGPKLRTNQSIYPFLFGPRFSYRRAAPLTIFVHALIGGAHQRTNFSGFVGTEKETAWAYDLGAGVDWTVAPHLAIRIIQADVLRTHFTQSFSVNAQWDWTASAGLVLRVGER